VVDGRILACHWVRLACQRHLNDLAAAQLPTYAYSFDDARSNRVCEFLEGLPHVKGSWAAQREDITLQPWQTFILCCLFGWIRRADGLRRFRTAYIAVPRKNGKSVLAAGIGLYMFAADGEFGSEIYSGATTEKQAWEVFRPAKQIAERTPDLQEAFGIEVGAKTMSIPTNGSRFEPVIGKPGDGASPHCAIVDEFHEHLTDSLLDTMRTGMGARKQPILLVITTAGDNLAGPCKAMQEELEKVLAGSVVRDELFGLVYGIDATDEWTSEEALRKANPNYNVSVFGDFLLTEQRNAIADARKQSVFKTKHLNVWVGANSAFVNMQKWNGLADLSLRADDFRGSTCVIGVDLSSKIDFSARVLIFRKLVDGKDHFYVFPRFYLPEERVNRPEFQHYQAWAAHGHIAVCPGARISHEQITEDTILDVQRYTAREVCCDPWGSDRFLEEIGKRTRATAVEVPQRVQYLSEPMKQLEALIADGCIHHDGNPAMTWMMGNLTAHEDKNENLFPNKERAESKIDGAVALITGLSRAVVIQAKSTQSIYATRGLRTL
jgi:phage terminase large subunit-like protein